MLTFGPVPVVVEVVVVDDASLSNHQVVTDPRVRRVRLPRNIGAAGARNAGVRMSRGRFAAHAWVAYGDQILGDQEWHVKSFAELDEVNVKDSA